LRFITTFFCARPSIVNSSNIIDLGEYYLLQYQGGKVRVIVQAAQPPAQHFWRWMLYFVERTFFCDIVQSILSPHYMYALYGAILTDRRYVCLVVVQSELKNLSGYFGPCADLGFICCLALKLRRGYWSLIRILEVNIHYPAEQRITFCQDEVW
jgi:hypothetical protein